MKRYVFLLYILAIFAVADKADIDQILEENQSNISLSEESQEINTEFSETLKSLNSDKMISLKKNSLEPWEYHFLK